MNLYVMRHGITVYNEKGITQGRINNRLSRQGVIFTEKVAKELKGIPFDVIIVSPLMRTMQTANIINKEHKVKVIKDINLIEIDQGIFTRRKKSSLSEEEQLIKRKRSKNVGMELYEECFNRTKNFVEEIKEKYNYKNILIVTHNIIATFIEDIINGEKINFNNDRFLRNFKNAEVKKFVI